MSQQLSEKILDLTDKGLSIFKELLPNVDFGKIEASNFRQKFKVRDEATPSASLKLINDKYILADFGEEQKGFNAIAYHAKIKNIDYVEALYFYAKKLGLNGVNPEPKKEFKKASKKDVVGTTFIYKDKFTDQELNTLGKFVNQDNCEALNLKSVESYTVVSAKGNKITIRATEDYPIFCFDFGTWQKKYEPLAKDKNDRFRYIGGRPQDFIFGLENVEVLQVEHAEDVLNSSDKEPSKKDLLLDHVVLCSGESDSINAISLGVPAVWLNSETAILTDAIYYEIKKYAKCVYILYDLDNTGITKAVDTALEHEDLKIIWLPSWIKTKKDFRGKPRKDFKDFVQVSVKSKFELTKDVLDLINTALPMRFWDEYYNPKKQAVNYKYNNSYAMHFLEQKGFFVYENEQSKDDYEFIKIDKNVVKKVKSHQIKKHLLEFLQDRKKPIELRNMLLRTNQLSDKSLSQLKLEVPSFSKATVDTQLLFFKKDVWKITKKGIEVKKPEQIDNKVWQSDILDFEPKIQSNHFTITEDDNGVFDIEIHETNNKHLNYLINASRMFWREDLETPFNIPGTDDFDLKAKAAYFKANQFNIAGSNLNDKQIQEQKHHLVNKIYAIGHLLHSYKSKGKAWATWNMDNKVIDDLESNGGTGKTVFYEMLFPILKNRKEIDGRVKNFTEDQFLFDGVTDKTDFTFIDDADPYMRFNRFFAPIQGNTQVNPKGGTPYTVDFKKSPKIAFASNFGLYNSDNSSDRRLLYILTSDYYHNKKKYYLENRRIVDDFNGKHLIQDFTTDDWNHYYNFISQCITFYLNHDQKINPPMENVEKRNTIRNIPNQFMNWANIYFSEESEKLNKEVNKIYAFDDFVTTEKMKNATSTKFKKWLSEWCTYKEYDLNPADYEGVKKDGRIMRKVKNKPTEFVLIRTEKTADIAPREKDIVPTIEPLPDNQKEDDVPF